MNQTPEQIGWRDQLAESMRRAVRDAGTRTAADQVALTWIVSVQRDALLAVEEKVSRIGVVLDVRDTVYAVPLELLLTPTGGA